MESTPEKTSVAIVEDHPMFCEQLAHLIEKEEGMMVCGTADNIRDGFELIKEKRPNLAIIDITLKGSNGLELLKDLKAQGIDLPTLVLSMHEESLYAERALRAGARGYITKHEASSKVMNAIRQVLAGEIYLTPFFMSRFVRKVVTGSGDSSLLPINRLTDRELEVFELIGRGQTNRQIGIRLCIGLTTVDTYRARIKEKLGLENAARLFTAAARWVQGQEACVS